MTIHITDGVYRELANKLTEHFDGDSYLSTSVRVDRKHYSVELNLTAILYYNDTRVELDRDCYGKSKQLSDIVPVWWEINTWWDEGDHDRQVKNDGQFSEIRNTILEL